MTAVVLVFSALVGLSVGSFLNVALYRLPRGESLLHPPSRCPSCGTPLGWRDNIPVMGWLLLRGKCRYCSAPISALYPAIEFAVGAVFLAVALAVT